MGEGAVFKVSPSLFFGVVMFLLQLIYPPVSIQFDTLVLVKVTVAFLVLAAVLWVVRKLIRTVNRS